MAVSIPGGPFTESILAARLVGNTERLACTFLDASTSQGSADERALRMSCPALKKRQPD